MGFTVWAETEYGIEIEDIMFNLDKFNDDDLLELKKQIESKVQKRTKRDNLNVLVASTLDEEYKIKILKEMFDKFSWSELEDIKKKIM
jgi:hypothetical protein